MWIPFRPAAPASSFTNAAKTILALFTIWIWFLLTAPLLILEIEQYTSFASWHFSAEGLYPLGIFLVLTGSILTIYTSLLLAIKGKGTILPFDEPRQLVVTGVYAHLRNPIAVSGVLQGLGIALISGSPMIYMSVLAGALFWNNVVRPAEEADLELRFGNRFQNYRKEVNCWIPRKDAYSEVFESPPCIPNDR